MKVWDIEIKVQKENSVLSLKSLLNIGVIYIEV